MVKAGATMMQLFVIMKFIGTEDEATVEHDFTKQPNLLWAMYVQNKDEQKAVVELKGLKSSPYLKANLHGDLQTLKLQFKVVFFR